ncbi:glycosyltransferase [Patescibacteria group bacterium]|nr:glycosyltransferase [Patescibacteria group bacterium]
MNVSPPKHGILLVTQVMDEDHQVLGFFVSWVRLLAQYGDPITIVCWSKGRCEGLPSNVEILEFPRGKWKRWSGLFKLSLQKRHEIRTVFVHMIPPVTAVLGLWWRMLGFRVVLWYTHGHVPLSLRFSERIVHTILTATDDSLKLATPKKVVTGHGIDLDIYHPVSGVTREPMLLSVSRISRRKDLMSFLKLCADLRARSPERLFKGVIIGEPCTEDDVAYLAELKQFIAAEKLESIIVWEGKRTGNALLALYSRAAVFISTSQTGSLDKVVLEAMACEVPVLATGSVYATLRGVCSVPSLNTEEVRTFITTCLAIPAAFPIARQEVRERADLSRLIEKIHQVLLS